MAAVIDWQRWAIYQREIEACLREGYTPIGEAGGKGSAIEEALRRLIAGGQVVLSQNTRGFLHKWCSIQARRAKRGLEHKEPDWTLFKRIEAARVVLTSRVLERHILTAAQNDTRVHGPFLANLKALASYYGARIHIGRFTYQVANNADRARERGEATRQRETTWAPEIEDYLTSARVGIGNLLWCAEMNTLPTAGRPLSGLHTYGQGKTAIFPHAKIALETVPTASGSTPPCVLTTGCCTIPSYTDTKAGHKAQFHHMLGAVVVEVDTEGRTFWRHVIGRPDGSFYDLDLHVSNATVTNGHRVEAITYGDLQLPFLDENVARATWGIDADTYHRVDGFDTMIEALRPRFGFYHDTIDFKSISHHDEKKPRERFRTFLNGGHLVESDLTRAARFIKAANREWQKAVVVESNHDKWLERWLDRCDHRKDRDNALAFLRWESARMEAEARGDTDFNIFRHALTESCDGHLPTEFVPEGGSFVICQSSGGIECGAHGHLGANGGPASPSALARVSGKANIADKHSPSIFDGLYVAGVSCDLRLGYNIGPSSWRHAHIVTYPNGKRTHIFIEDGRWRA